MEQNAQKIAFTSELFAFFALDIIGVFLLALGAYLRFGNNILIPESLRFAHDSLVYMTLGILLSLLLLFYIIKVGKSRQQAQNAGKSESTVRTKSHHQDDHHRTHDFFWLGHPHQHSVST